MKISSMNQLKMFFLSTLVCNMASASDLTFDKWKSENSKMVIGSHEISYRVTGKGPWLTLIHGFPTSSMDWAKVLPELSQHYTVLVFDFIGFGDSSKPQDYNYSTFERANLIENIWKQLGINSTFVAAHDFGGTVLLELLHRAKNNFLTTKVRSAVFLNGGLFTDLHRPLSAQQALLSPFGFIFKNFITYSKFNEQLRSCLGIQIDETEVSEMWNSIENRNGLSNYHKLIRYIIDRRENRDRWEPLISDNTIPKKFIWGMKDPISGAHMLQEIVKKNPQATVTELSEAGHFPQLEDPKKVADEIISFFK